MDQNALTIVKANAAELGSHLRQLIADVGAQKEGASAAELMMETGRGVVTLTEELERLVNALGE